MAASAHEGVTPVTVTAKALGDLCTHVKGGVPGVGELPRDLQYRIASPSLMTAITTPFEGNSSSLSLLYEDCRQLYLAMPTKSRGYLNERARFGYVHATVPTSLATQLFGTCQAVVVWWVMRNTLGNGVFACIGMTDNLEGKIVAHVNKALAEAGFESTDHSSSAAGPASNKIIQAPFDKGQLRIELEAQQAVLSDQHRRELDAQHHRLVTEHQRELSALESSLLAKHQIELGKVRAEHSAEQARAYALEQEMARLKGEYESLYSEHSRVLAAAAAASADPFEFAPSAATDNNTADAENAAAAAAAAGAVNADITSLPPNAPNGLKFAAAIAKDPGSFPSGLLDLPKLNSVARMGAVFTGKSGTEIAMVCVRLLEEANLAGPGWLQRIPAIENVKLPRPLVVVKHSVLVEDYISNLPLAISLWHALVESPTSPALLEMIGGKANLARLEKEMSGLQ